ncbi:MAG: DUF6152 family protein [Steroidobacteraceae bacterium]
MNIGKRGMIEAMTVIALGLLSSVAWSHHSTAAYDRDHKVLVEGTVKDFKWTNPHSWLFMSVPDDKGGIDEWAFECGSVVQLKNIGWTRNKVKAGDKVKIVAIIARDGTRRGEVQTLVTADGEKLQNRIGY